VSVVLTNPGALIQTAWRNKKHKTIAICVSSHVKIATATNNVIYSLLCFLRDWNTQHNLTIGVSCVWSSPKSYFAMCLPPKSFLFALMLAMILVSLKAKLPLVISILDDEPTLWSWYLRVRSE
jgi:hypothetical protein